MATFFQTIAVIFSSSSNAPTVGHNVETTGQTSTPAGASRSNTDSSKEPIYFYDSDKPFYEFTSFSDHPVEYHGLFYPTAEHLFQAFKFMDTDPALAERIRRLPTARMAQQEAKRQLHRQRADWLEVNVAIMDKVIAAKFAQHRSLRHSLRSTGSRELIEDSPVDWFWGIGSDGRGRNELGKALMRLRERLHARQRY
ncbi:DUF1768-domain-containing protein [Multifurca ochricompacta]|uniref:DUF1768-domain-containing protein n=1 Tax=Multifurca ochricompacta TaxID=376703 RepID=A0AAD4QNB9_9AGAM|nr:DUF1768-domain-containing protein [Multifurca ochricompacta]